MKHKRLAMLSLLWSLSLQPLQAQTTLKLLTGGAFHEAAAAILPGFEAASGIKVEVSVDTGGNLVKRIEAGEQFDVVVVTHEGLQRLSNDSLVIAATAKDIAKVGVGVGIKQGAPKPALANVEDFKKLLRNAKHVAYTNPTAGGTSGIYLDGLFKRLGMADVVAPKAVLSPGGYAAEKIVKGEADVVFTQASEILPVKGVTLAGMLPEEIQNYTTYSGGISQHTSATEAAKKLLDALSSKEAANAIGAKGMTPLP